MIEVASFADLDPQFTERVQRIVWASATTIDTAGRTRTRILHPMWEGETGWIITMRHSLKEKHLAANPWISLSYWDPQHAQVYVECRADWADDPDEKRGVWELFKATPMPYGYDPAEIFGTAENPETGILRLTPWRAEISGLPGLGDPTKKVWQASTG